MSLTVTLADGDVSVNPLPTFEHRQLLIGGSYQGGEEQAEKNGKGNAHRPV